MAITVNSGVDLAAGVKLASLTAGTITAALASGGPYAYSGVTLAAPTTLPSLTAGTLSIDGAGTYVFSMSAGIISMTPAAAGTYVMNGCTFSGIIDLRNTSAFSITVKVPNSATVITSNNTGGAITIDNSVSVIISAPNLLLGSRVRLYNVTDSVELYNDVLSSTGFNYNFSWLTNKTMRLTATYCVGTSAKLELSAIGVVGSSGLTFLDAQVDDSAYNTLAINGSTVTGFAADYVNFEVNLTTGANFNGADLYAWWVYNTTTENGIRNFFGGITGIDVANFRINASVVSIYLDNTTTTSVYQLDNRRIFRTDGIYPVRTPTSGGGGIDVNWRDQVLLVQSDQIAQIAATVELLPDAAENAAATLAAINTTPPDVNISKINGLLITGVGTEATPWGPA
jgi:hypothetical protein